MWKKKELQFQQYLIEKYKLKRTKVARWKMISFFVMVGNACNFPYYK